MDLGSSQQVCGARLDWETAYATAPFAVFTVGGGDGGGGNGSCPWVGSTAPVSQRVAQLMAQMTQDQKISMLHGNGNASPYIGNTSFAFANLQVGALGSGGTTVTATVTNTGVRAGAVVAQLYVGAPASAGEPVHRLKGFQRVEPQPGQSQTVRFTVTARDLAHWADAAGGWTTTPGTYPILVGDSSRNLPLSGSINVTSTLRSDAAGTRSRTGTVAAVNPYGMSSPVGAEVALPVTARSTAGGRLSFSATGLPEGLSISRTGVISGSARHAGTRTATVTATGTGGVTGSATKQPLSWSFLPLTVI